MNHLMIDLETLGTSTSSVIASIGAVVFDETGVKQELEINVNIESCLDVGMKMDVSTVIWWLQQSREAIDATFMQETMFIGPALSELWSFYDENMCERIWSHGATFDIPIIGEAVRLCKMEREINMPCRFARDTRTLFELTGVDPRKFFDGGTKHSAIDDARAQALAVIAAWDIIEGWKTIPPSNGILHFDAGKTLTHDEDSPKIPEATGSAEELAHVKSAVADLEVPALLKRTTK